MSKTVEVGRIAHTHYGKYLAEICRNLKSRGIGRIVVKEGETTRFPEPSFFILQKVDLLMSDSSHKRCRVMAHRVYRGKDLGVVSVKEVYQPDWRLLSIEDANRLLQTYKEVKPAPVRETNVIFQVPPTTSLFLRNSSKLGTENSPILMQGSLKQNPCVLQKAKQITVDQKSLLHPCFKQVADDDEAKPLTRYYIKRSDTPAAHWRIEIEPDTRDEILKKLD
ncbi:ribosomal protein S34 [Cichlidogyrus casuarinus]|uniref:Ribosomal protein S34 n=1 Tax=Cichlidogyrus casuarinus TaxID=1844966 RepID=A0ABD2Q443_9PLAT